MIRPIGSQKADRVARSRPEWELLDRNRGQLVVSLHWMIITGPGGSATLLADRFYFSSLGCSISGTPFLVVAMVFFACRRQVECAATDFSFCSAILINMHKEDRKINGGKIDE
jgi:hypothetical protein